MFGMNLNKHIMYRNKKCVFYFKCLPCNFLTAATTNEIIIYLRIYNNTLHLYMLSGK